MGAESGRRPPRPANRYPAGSPRTGLALPAGTGGHRVATVRPYPRPHTEAPLHKRSLRFASALIALGLLTAACGDDDDTGSDDHHHRGHRRRLDRWRLRRRRLPGRSSTTCARRRKDAGVEVPDGFTVRLVTDIGKIDDRTFNQYAYEGMQAAAECFGFETDYIETASEADYAKNINTALEDDPDVVITTGFLLATDTLAAAEANTETKLHRHRPVPARVPGQLRRRALQRGRRRLHGRRAWPPRSARAASSASSAAARTSRRSSSWSTATRPAPSRSTPTSTC